MIVLDKISKRFGREMILEDISCQIMEGITTCIIGENGSGKSTLLSIMAGVLLPDSGAVYYGDQRLPPDKTSLTLLPQQDYLFEQLTVEDNLKFWASAAGCSIRDETVQNYIALFEVGSFFKKKVAALSGGMRRRVALCAALVGDPSIIIFDEPFSGLDMIHKTELCQFLQRISVLGKTVIYTAHNVDEVFLMAQNLLVLSNKKLAYLPVPKSMDQLNLDITKYLKGEMPNG